MAHIETGTRPAEPDQYKRPDYHPYRRATLPSPPRVIQPCNYVIMHLSVIICVGITPRLDRGYLGYTPYLPTPLNGVARPDSQLWIDCADHRHTARRVKNCTLHPLPPAPYTGSGARVMASKSQSVKCVATVISNLLASRASLLHLLLNDDAVQISGGMQS